jgi:uroporphyrinogen III methyltransferase/synthase
MEHRAEIAARLMAGGRAPETPVVVVQWGTTAAERSVRGKLADLHAVELGAPATIVVGAVAGLDLRGGRRPLSEVSVVVTRPRAQSDELVAGLAGAGASVIVLPVIVMADPVDEGPLSTAAAHADGYDWIVFTSANAVDRFVERLRDGRALGRARLATVGPATAAALGRWHLVADLVAAGPGGASLAAAMPDAPALADPTTTARVLFPRAAGAGEVLAAGLRTKGWEVDEVEAYRTVAATAADGAAAEVVEAAAVADVITFGSPSAVTHYLALSGGRVPAVVACIGPSTAGAAEAAGLVVDVVAAEQSDEGLIRALIHRYEN